MVQLILAIIVLFGTGCSTVSSTVGPAFGGSFIEPIDASQEVPARNPGAPRHDPRTCIGSLLLNQPLDDFRVAVELAQQIHPRVLVAVTVSQCEQRVVMPCVNLHK